MEDIYIIIYDSETFFEITTDPAWTIGYLIQRGFSYDDMRIFKGNEIDFTVDFGNMEVKLKDA